ncbi:putative acetyltransferase [Deinococcus sp. HSC-46F16]|uniref:GNAT family N-acetyltransferase n=1 Tax=Deinococcus sp. HSC-46F16 TaxID=2910968 RepID=UPI00209F5FD2|nr:putative acetyltransferase [Deinococcus sp. HSC-46F16]
MTVHLRPERPADADTIAEVTRLAFTSNGGVRENEMIGEIRASGRFLPDLSLVAELGGRVVGHVLVSPTDLQGDPEQPERPRRVLLLGPLSVLPEFQRRAIGSALMRGVLARLQERPEPMVVLWGHEAYYPRFGFRPASDFGLEPDSPAAMVYPLRRDLSAYAGLKLPH